MSTRKSITFSKGNAEWLADEANLRDYGSQSDLINALVRQERERQARRNWLDQALWDGYNSGRAGKPSIEEVLSRAEARRKKRA